MRNAYLEQLYELAQGDKRVLALISDNGAIIYDKYRRDFPEQYMNFGIAEANMIAAAAGLASRGKIPFTYTIGAFLAYRALEFIRNDVCYQKQNVKIVGIGAGCAYANLGPTHHATEDIAILRAMPNLTLFSPASPLEARKVTQAAYEIEGPVYIRLGRNGEPEFYERDYEFRAGKGVVLREGSDITLVGTGTIVTALLAVADELRKDGIAAGVVNIHTLKPFDEELIISLAKKTGILFTAEDHSVYGGLGSIVADVIALHGLQVKFSMLGLKGFAEGYGSYDEMREQNGLSNEAIIQQVKKMLG